MTASGTIRRYHTIEEARAAMLEQERRLGLPASSPSDDDLSADE